MLSAQLASKDDTKYEKLNKYSKEKLQFAYVILPSKYVFFITIRSLKVLCMLSKR